MRQFLLFIVTMLVLAGCASQATFGDAITVGEPTPIPTPIVPNKPIYQVERGNIVYEREFFGRVTPVVSRELQFALDGRIIETFFSSGDTVNAGDILAELDTSLLEEQLLVAQADLEIAQSILQSATNQVVFGQQRAQLNLDLAQLRLDHAISQASDPPTANDNFLITTREIERDLAQLSLDELIDGVDPELRVDVTRAQNLVDDIQASIANTQLIAPIAGRLSGFSVSAGDMVSAFESVGVVDDLTELEVTDSMDTGDMSELVEGMPVSLFRSIRTDDRFNGTIVALPAPFGTATDELVHIRFEMPPALDEIVAGDRLTFEVVIEERNDVLWLPSSAIRQFGGRNFVVVQIDSFQQRVDVQLGLEGDNRVEILEGLEENQTVIGP